MSVSIKRPDSPALLSGLSRASMPIFGRFSEKRPPLDRNGSRPGDVKRAFLSLFPRYFAVFRGLGLASDQLCQRRVCRMPPSTFGHGFYPRSQVFFPSPVHKSGSQVPFTSPVHKSRSQVDRQTVVYPFPALRKTPKQVPHDPSSR